MTASTMHGIDTRLFRYFVAVAEDRHFGRAAARLAITPSTLTHQIQKLERDVGARLLLRGAHSGVGLTEAGQRFLNQARVVLREVDEAMTVARQAARGEIGTLAIGYMTVVACSGLMRHVNAFKAANPKVQILLHNRPTMGQFEGLLKRDIDVGFTRPPKQYPAELRGFVFCEQDLIVAMPADHPLARRMRPVAPGELKDEAFVNTALESDFGFQRQTEDLAEAFGFVPRVVARVPEILSVLAYVSAGYGIAVCSESISRIQIPNVVYKPLAGKTLPRSTIAFVHRRNETSPVALRFIKEMRRVARNA